MCLHQMNNVAKLKDKELRMFVLFLLSILEMRSLTLECAPCVCFFRKLCVSLGKNPLKIFKSVRNEEPTV